MKVVEIVGWGGVTYKSAAQERSKIVAPPHMNEMNQLA